MMILGFCSIGLSSAEEHGTALGVIRNPSGKTKTPSGGLLIQLP
jgi:hypothetical protein